MEFLLLLISPRNIFSPFTIRTAQDSTHTHKTTNYNNEYIRNKCVDFSTFYSAIQSPFSLSYGIVHTILHVRTKGAAAHRYIKLPQQIIMCNIHFEFRKQNLFRCDPIVHRYQKFFICPWSGRSNRGMTVLFLVESWVSDCFIENIHYNL